MGTNRNEVHPGYTPDIAFYSADEEKTLYGMGTSNTFTARMPEEAEIGDRIAIVFEGDSDYDNWFADPQNDYGGFVWYAWIYTYTENA